MSYLRQQRALFAVVGVAAGAAVFVDTKARTVARSSSPARLRLHIQACALPGCHGAGARTHAGCAIAAPLPAPDTPKALRVRGLGADARSCSANPVFLVCRSSRAQRLLLRATAGISEGWVNPPPPSAPLPVRRSNSCLPLWPAPVAHPPLTLPFARVPASPAACSAAAVRSAQGTDGAQLEQRCAVCCA
jgi:hypothetical protein